MAQPTSVREKVSHLVIYNFSPYSYTLNWIDPESLGVAADFIDASENLAEVRVTIKTTPGHRFILSRDGHDDSTMIESHGILDLLYIEYDGSLYHSHR
jgi:hypothetical protein